MTTTMRLMRLTSDYRHIMIAAFIVFGYLGATAAFSPRAEWWIVDDTPMYLDGARLVAAGESTATAYNITSLRHAHPPLYYHIVAWLNVGSPPWPLLIFQALLVVIAAVVTWSASETARWVRYVVMCGVILFMLPQMPTIHYDSIGAVLSLLSLLALFRQRYITAGILLGWYALIAPIGLMMIFILAACALLYRPRWSILLTVWIGLLQALPQIITVYQDEDILGTCTHTLSAVMPKMIAAVDSEGDPSKQVALALYDYAAVDTSRQMSVVVAEHRNAAIDALWERRGKIPRYLVTVMAYTLFSSNSPWDSQWPVEMVPRSARRVVYGAVGLLSLVGIFMSFRHLPIRLAVPLVLIYLVTVSTVIIGGGIVAARLLLPSVLPRAVFVAIGIKSLKEGFDAIRNHVSRHRI